jgi:hypothetical protein
VFAAVTHGHYGMVVNRTTALSGMDIFALLNCPFGATTKVMNKINNL